MTPAGGALVDVGVNVDAKRDGEARIFSEEASDTPAFAMPISP